jgi:hypothetical protein
MSQTEHHIYSPDAQEWESMVHEVEKRFEELNDAVHALRSAMFRLTAYRPQLQQPAAGGGEPILVEEPVPGSAGREADWDADETADAATPSLEAPAVDDDAARREEVSRMVAEAKREIQSSASSLSEGSWPVGGLAPDSTSEGSWPVARSDPDSTSEGSWPVVRRGASSQASRLADLDEVLGAAAGGPETGAPAAASAPEDSWRLDVADVEGPAESIAESGSGRLEGTSIYVEDDVFETVSPASDYVPEADEEDDAARRAEVARMVEEMRGGIVLEAADEAPEGSEEDDEARRLEVSRMVAEMRAQMNAGSQDFDDGGPMASENEPEYEDRRREVADMVAKMRAEMSAGAAAVEDEGVDIHPSATSDDSAVRDEVRRAVEAARAEMSSGWVGAGSSTASPSGSEEKKFSFPDWQNARVEPSGPPVIVIKDPEGRVELARVYETLNRVDCDENAALLNYTPHSVTVGLNMRATVPTREGLASAVEAVFGRKCRVESDGVRLSVEIGRDSGGKEDAA